MITILSIVGETLDLQTGEEHSKGLMLSNGITTKVVEVSDEVIHAVVTLFAEASSKKLSPQSPEEVEVETRSSKKPKKEPRYTDGPQPGPASVETLTGVGSI